MHRRLAGVVGLTLVMALAIPGAGVARAAGLDVGPRLVASLPTGDFGSFAESLAVSGENLYVSLTVWSVDEATPNDGQIWKLTPNGKLARFGPRLDVCLFTGLAFDDAGRLYVGTYSCDVDFTLPSGVLRIDPDGTVTRVLTLPAGTFPNGLAIHAGYLYVSDPLNGAIWRVPQGGTGLTPTTPWLQIPLLAPTKKVGLGVNGLAFWGDTLYAVNYSTGAVITIPIASGGAAGSPTVVVRDRSLVTADGIAFDVLGRLWITVNTGSVARVDRDGRISTVASDPAWLDYPVQPAFGMTAPARTTLYVANGSMNNGTPNVVAFDFGVAGQRLP